ncbi:hypothetical protein COCC4DRAFT_63521 [Bipolaris maydis ATCC 48331]|uniref:Uncharacterized protein n=2 Tax=Cochliobolus heterostrophus TaxID=5016 RepID=M2UVT8_COCH5|nr:uncharacterized protein COCC4DRAFT_63521 [Bipolaris maydis ATCC 48331]EMD91917.1 hypothetical protein COCHEDRAFT_1154938 [Bipolaris maydis C5]ENI02600.1 hypothetical protein COCC4DRAFT_63521 [Bipolaris maydis ATCC 48331]
MTTVIYQSIAAHTHRGYMVASSGGFPSFDNKAFWSLFTPMHPLSAFGCPHRWSSLPTSCTLELVSHSRIISCMQTLRDLCTTSRRPTTYHDIRQCYTLNPSAIQAPTKRTFVGPEIQASYPAA